MLGNRPLAREFAGEFQHAAIGRYDVRAPALIAAWIAAYADVLDRPLLTHAQIPAPSD